MEKGTSRSDEIMFIMAEFESQLRAQKNRLKEITLKLYGQRLEKGKETEQEKSPEGFLENFKFSAKRISDVIISNSDLIAELEEFI